VLPKKGEGVSGGLEELGSRQAVLYLVRFGSLATVGSVLMIATVNNVIHEPTTAKGCVQLVPPLPSPGKVIKMTLGGSVEDSNFENIFHIQYAGSAPTSTQLDSLQAALSDAYSYIYSHNGSTSLTLTSVKLVDLSSDLGAEYETTFSVAGTVDGTVNPANVATVVSWEILRRYRGGHPRIYLMTGSSDTFATGSTRTWQPSYIANVQNDCISYLSAVAAASIAGFSPFVPVSVSYYSGKELRDTPVVDAIQTAVSRTRVCSQRRRTGKSEAIS
jgi:hypothetical protein